MITAGDAAILLGAGAVAGLVGSAGGITSLVSYPASLLELGYRLSPPTWPTSSPWLAAGQAQRSPSTGAGRQANMAAALGSAGRRPAVKLALCCCLATAPSTLRRRPRRSLRGRGFRALPAAGSLGFGARANKRRRQASRLALLPAGLLTLSGSQRRPLLRATQGSRPSTMLLLLVDTHCSKSQRAKTTCCSVLEHSTSAAISHSSQDRSTGRRPCRSASGCSPESSVGPRVTRRLPATVLRLLIALLGISLAVELLGHTPSFLEQERPNGWLQPR